jgi:integrase/recombinase XerD
VKRLTRAAANYLALRRALGFKLRHQTWWLPDFIAYLETHRSSVITTELAMRWAQQPSDADPSWWAKRLGAVRQFAKYHRAFDPRTEVPPKGLIPAPRRRQRPHLYSDTEIKALMRQASALPHPLQAATYTTLIGLLATTGMRVGEAIALDENDVDCARSLVTVRDSKFRKSRHVPVHASTLAALSAYARRRDRVRQRRSSSFFISLVGTRLHEQNVWRIFAGMRERAELTHQSGRPPRIHDMRHSFAVSTLRNWYRAGVDVEQRLPWLSTYLGHVSPSTTYWYLTATPELLALASKRAERAWKVRP